jgi:hypothetical protein
MIKPAQILLIIHFLLAAILAGCFQDSPAGSDRDQDRCGTVAADALAGIEANGLTIIESVTAEGATGYLAVDGNGKKFLILQGSAEAMGYQMGYLMAEGVYRMTKEFTGGVIKSLSGIDPVKTKILFDYIISEGLVSCKNALPSIPGYLQEEMAGVARGASDRGYEVTFDDVLLLNEGIDALFAMIMTGVLPSLAGKGELPAEVQAEIENNSDTIEMDGDAVRFLKADPFVLGCNEFVISGNATADGGVYHGRDFMFPTAHIYQDVACMAVYLPDNGLPFTCVTAPGFVGQTTGINSQGLSMGMDVVMGTGTRSTPGMCCLLVMRDIVQNCPGLDTAVARMKTQDRGVSWLYILGDDEYSDTYTNGIVIEEGMSADSSGEEINGPDTLRAWQEYLLAPWINLLDNTLPERGIMTRTQDWIYPEEFQDIGFAITLPDGSRTLGLYFPEQIESWSDLVMATNHYIIPRMAFTSMDPWISLVRDTTDSEWRYGELYKILEQEYGTIDFDTARDIIDFLNPNCVYGDLEYYEKGGEIEGHHAVFDNTGLVLEGLFGYYGSDPSQKTPWARVELGSFLE